MEQVISIEKKSHVVYIHEYDEFRLQFGYNWKNYTRS